MKRITVMFFGSGTSTPDYIKSGFFYLASLVLLVGLFSCSPARHVTKQVNDLSSKFAHHSAFVLVDPHDGKLLVNVNGEKYFTPASNTKILTFFAGLSVLGDSVPAFYYRKTADSLIISGSGDPSFLYSGTYTTPHALNFLKSFPGQIYLSPRIPTPEKLGPGWAWDDYDQGYQPERSEFPIYGNLLTIQYQNPSWKVMPAYFKDSISQKSESNPYWRKQSDNYFYASAQTTPSTVRRIPFLTSLDRAARLLSDTLKNSVIVLSKPIPTENKFYATPSDSLYKTMMQKSDNGIAEQLLMMVADRLSDSLNAEAAIQRILQHELALLPQKPIWVDGSGLSRYNQITPLAVVEVWKKILTKRKLEQLLPLLAASGRNGTLQSMSTSTRPFVFGKTGTLSNNYSLSGYLFTNKDRLLIFSSMNANFTVSARKVRDELERILTYIHEHY